MLSPGLHDGFTSPKDSSKGKRSGGKLSTGDSLETISSSGSSHYGKNAKNVDSNGNLSPQTGENGKAFRRTYSSNSIKVRQVEVGPSSFVKLKMLGKGETGAAYALHEATKQLRAIVGEKQFSRWAPFVHFGI